MRSLTTLTLACAGLVLSLFACGEGEIGDYVTHDEPEDFIEAPGDVQGISNSFNKNNVVDDALYTDTSLSGDQIQGFFENAPYYGGMRSWLADLSVNGMRASDALVDAARAEGINPLMLLARMQVEKSLVSKRQRPSGKAFDYAMGCGCPDNRPCNTQYKGFDKQMRCAAQTLKDRMTDSMTGQGAWRVGRAKRTLDPESVTPANHATAALYAYTPWILRNSGGNWLVWNVTKKYAGALAVSTPVPSPMPSPPGNGGEDEDEPPGPAGDAWIGTTCEADSECNLSASGVSNGECHNWFDEGNATLFGFCSAGCSGFCKDKTGEDRTFCAELSGQGQCVAVAGPSNTNCNQIPGTVKAAKQRHGGSSAWADVCVPKHEAIQCTSGGSDGICINTQTTSCGGQVASGACPGSSSIRCCLD